jgi:hypothetical protein
LSGVKKAWSPPHGRWAIPAIDERVENAAVAKPIDGGPDPRGVEREKLRVAHLSPRHREFAVGAAADIPDDPHIVGLVGQDQTSLRIAVHQASEDGWIGRIAAYQPMVTRKRGPELG